MFERNRIDNAPATTAVPVAIAFTDGNHEKGRLFIPVGRNLQDCLNGNGTFLEFEPYGGERSYLAKASIFSLKLIGVPKVPNLSNYAGQKDDFDPFAILSAAPGSDWQQIRAAYVERAKTYHPDRYSSAELPSEVRDYLATMARRINLAFETLQSAQKVHKEVARAKTEPVYTSKARA